MVAEQAADRPEREPEGQDAQAPDAAETMPDPEVMAAMETQAATEAATATPAEETGAAENAAKAEEDSPELTARLEEARAEAVAAQERLLRTHAELENLKRRQANELEKAHKFALDGFVRELLQVRDSLELGHTAALDEGTDLAKLREGTELTLKLLGDVMGKFGVAQLDPRGEPFDPEYHQAMTMQPTAEAAPNTVVTVVQKGYLLNGRLVRPAMVIVAAEPAAEQS
ncbi:MAG: nucleotide exchange factor GrpE [Candidatus Thiosymbion ectosymbiont of Robbea hypermnestra]|nr:nucleotide exchange factor GrpE [Candidatus Thiosymbion ectosymbiont of Robbea hypermnestra]